MNQESWGRRGSGGGRDRTTHSSGMKLAPSISGTRLGEPTVRRHIGHHVRLLDESSVRSTGPAFPRLRLFFGVGERGGVAVATRFRWRLRERHTMLVVMVPALSRAD